MDIPYYYRKFIEKSRAFLTERVNGRQVNIFLFITALAVLALAVIFALFAAGKPRGTAGGAKRTNISISPQCIDLFGMDTISALIQEFEDQNPGLRILTADQKAALDTGGCDIVFFDDGAFRSLINDSYINTVTLVSFMDVFVYNIDILKAANCDRPPKTRAEFLTAARAVADINKVSPGQKTVSAFALGLSQADTAALRRDFYPWVWMNGGDINSIEISRQVADIISFFGLLNREGLLSPGTFEKTGTQRLEEFAEGKIAMMTASMRDITFLRSNGINFDITAIPASAPGKNRLGLSNIYAGINGDCALPDEASIFLDFIVEKSHILAEALGAVPGSFPNIFSGEYIAQDPLFSKAWDIFQMADIVEYKPEEPLEEEVNRIIREKLAEAFNE